MVDDYPEQAQLHDFFLYMHMCWVLKYEKTTVFHLIYYSHWNNKPLTPTMHFELYLFMFCILSGLFIKHVKVAITYADVENTHVKIFPCTK